MSHYLTREQVIEALRQQVSRITQKAWALEHRISPAYVNDVLQGHRAPGPTLLAALGFEHVELYRKATP